MKDNNYRLCVKVALLYYKYDFNQPEIAQKLGISRQKVGRLLKQAKEQGIVKISIHSEVSYYEEYSATLEELFSLREVIIVDVPLYEEKNIKEELGRAGAEFLKRIVTENDSLSISWSSTVYECIKNIRDFEISGMTFSQLNGSHEKVPYIYSGLNLVNMLGECCRNSHIYPLLAPMKVDSYEILQSIMKDDTIKRSMKIAEESRIALFGVGSISSESSLYEAGYMDSNLLKRLGVRHAVGDVCGHFINALGEICDRESDIKTVAISEASLKRKEYRIAIAGGKQKSDAIMAALRGGWCNVLITDMETAEIIVRQCSQQ